MCCEWRQKAVKHFCFYLFFQLEASQLAASLTDCCECDIRPSFFPNNFPTKLLKTTLYLAFYSIYWQAVKETNKKLSRWCFAISGPLQRLRLGSSYHSRIGSRLTIALWRCSACKCGHWQGILQGRKDVGVDGTTLWDDVLINNAKSHAVKITEQVIYLLCFSLHEAPPMQLSLQQQSCSAAVYLTQLWCVGSMSGLSLLWSSEA